MSELINFAEGKLLGGSNAQNFLALGVVEKFAVGVQKFQGIPLFRIMAGGDDNSSGSVLGNSGDFGGGSGCKADVHYIEAHCAKSRNHNRTNHGA